MRTMLAVLLTPQTNYVLAWSPALAPHISAFATTPHGWQALEERFNRSAPCALTLVCDFPEESYQPESLPPVTGGVLRQLLQRKLQQSAPDAPYTVVYQAIAGGPTAQRFVLCAFTPPVTVQTWFTQLVTRQSLVQGLTSVAMVCQQWVHAMAHEAPQVLLVLQYAGQLRISLYQSHQLLFSRALRLERHSDSPDLQALLHTLASEISQTSQYLMSKQLILEGRPMHIAVMSATLNRQTGLANTSQATATLNDALMPVMQSSRVGQLTLHLYTDVQIQRLCQIPEIPGLPDSHPDTQPVDGMIVCLLVSSVFADAALQFSAPALTLSYHIRRAKRRLRFILLGLASLAGLIVWQLHTIYWPPRMVPSMPPRLDAPHTARKPVTLSALAGLQQLLAIEATLLSAQRSPAPLLSLLNRLQDAHLYWRIEHLYWAYGPAPALPNKAIVAQSSASNRDWQMHARIIFAPVTAADPIAVDAAWQTLSAELRMAPMVAAMQVIPSGDSHHQAAFAGDTRQLHPMPAPSEVRLWLK